MPLVKWSVRRQMLNIIIKVSEMQGYDAVVTDRKGETHLVLLTIV